MSCWICDVCRIVIGYEQAPKKGPHFCSEDCKKEYK